jgi:hypothetical protein
LRPCTSRPRLPGRGRFFCLCGYRADSGISRAPQGCAR